MNMSKHAGNAERLGCWLGGVWRGYVRREQHGATWLKARGVPAGGAVALLWIIKLAAFGILLYTAFWLALLLVLALLGAWMIRKTMEAMTRGISPLQSTLAKHNSETASSFASCPNPGEPG